MPAGMHTPSSDVAPMDDLDILVMPTVTHAHTTGNLTIAAPSIPQHVRDVMARVNMQQKKTGPGLVLECAPTAVPPAAQVGRGPVAEAIARHLVVQAERSEAARVAAQAERDRCYATARLLARAGWHEKAEAAIAAAPNHARTAAPLPSALEGIVSLRPTARKSTIPTSYITST